jgi:hypothetical protein
MKQSRRKQQRNRREGDWKGHASAPQARKAIDKEDHEIGEARRDTDRLKKEKGDTRRLRPPRKRRRPQDEEGPENA